MLQEQTTNELPGKAVGGEGWWLSEFFDRIAFSATIDVPLAIVLILLFLLSFHAWAKSANSETLVDLPSRLPKACFRAIFFFLCLLAFCYFTGIAVWAVIATFLAVGFVLSVILGDENVVELMLRICIVFFREACFGFPTLILDGPAETGDQCQSTNKDIVGKHGTTTSPLRPSGYISINDEELPAVSDTGEMIDTGSKVVVTRIRNGQVCVRPDEL